MNGDRNIIPIIKNDERIQNVIGFSKARYEARNYSIDTKASPETSKELIKDIFGIESQSLGLRILSFLFFPDEIRMELSKRSIWDVEAVHLSITISKDSVVLSAQLDEFNSKKLKRYKNKLNSDQGLLRRFVGGGKYSHTYEYSEGSGEGLSFTPIRMYSHQIEIPYDCFTGFMLELKAFNSTP
jgi:hypothetical protein